MATSVPHTLARLVASAALAFGLANAVHAVAGAAPIRAISDGTASGATRSAGGSGATSGRSRTT